MLVYLKANRAAFDDGEVQTLTAAFDKAWEAVQTSGAKFATDGHVEAARAVIAKHIIEAARQGERDQRRLRDGAIIAYTRANLRTAPRDSNPRRRDSQLSSRGC